MCAGIGCCPTSPAKLREREACHPWFWRHANSQRGGSEDDFDDIASKLCSMLSPDSNEAARASKQHQQDVKHLARMAGTLPACSLTVAEKGCAALFCMAPHSQAVQHLGKALLGRFVQIIAICFGIVHWALQQAAQHCVHGRRRLSPTPSNDCDDVGASPTNLACLHCQ